MACSVSARIEKRAVLLTRLLRSTIIGYPSEDSFLKEVADISPSLYALARKNIAAAFQEELRVVFSHAGAELTLQNVESFEQLGPFVSLMTICGVENPLSLPSSSQPKIPWSQKRSSFPFGHREFICPCLNLLELQVSLSRGRT